MLKSFEIIDYNLYTTIFITTSQVGLTIFILSNLGIIFNNISYISCYYKILNILVME